MTTTPGHVEPQHATRRTLPGATIIKMSVGPMDNNTYLVTCSRTGETLLDRRRQRPGIAGEARR